MSEHTDLLVCRYVSFLLDRAARKDGTLDLALCDRIERLLRHLDCVRSGARPDAAAK